MNTLPRPKIHENENARQRAYQQRKRDERKTLLALTGKMLTGVSFSVAVQQLMQELTPGQCEALQRLAVSQNSETNLKNVAG